MEYSGVFNEEEIFYFVCVLIDVSFFIIYMKLFSLLVWVMISSKFVL